MKEITVILQPFKVDAVTDALQEIAGVGGITALDVRGFGHQRGALGMDVRAKGAVNYTRKVMLCSSSPTTWSRRSSRRSSGTGTPATSGTGRCSCRASMRRFACGPANEAKGRSDHMCGGLPWLVGDRCSIWWSFSVRWG